MYRIKHIPTGLYYQPRKYRSRVYNEIKENAGWLFDTTSPSTSGVHLFSEPEHFKLEEV